MEHPSTGSGQVEHGAWRMLSDAETRRQGDAVKKANNTEHRVKDFVFTPCSMPYAASLTTDLSEQKDWIVFPGR
jgi:hypothetical protein